MEINLKPIIFDENSEKRWMQLCGAMHVQWKKKPETYPSE